MWFICITKNVVMDGDFSVRQYKLWQKLSKTELIFVERLF